MKNLKFIPNSETPIKTPTKWDALFLSIPKGKTLVLTESEVNPDSARGSLLRRKRNGQYKNLRAIIRGKRGKRVTYIMNITEE